MPDLHANPSTYPSKYELNTNTHCALVVCPKHGGGEEEISATIVELVCGQASILGKPLIGKVTIRYDEGDIIVFTLSSAVLLVHDAFYCYLSSTADNSRAEYQLNSIASSIVDAPATTTTMVVSEDERAVITLANHILASNRSCIIVDMDSIRSTPWTRPYNIGVRRMYRKHTLQQNGSEVISDVTSEVVTYMAMADISPIIFKELHTLLTVHRNDIILINSSSCRAPCSNTDIFVALEYLCPDNVLVVNNERFLGCLPCTRDYQQTCNLNWTRVGNLQRGNRIPSPVVGQTTLELNIISGMYAAVPLPPDSCLPLIEDYKRRLVPRFKYFKGSEWMPLTSGGVYGGVWQTACGVNADINDNTRVQIDIIVQYRHDKLYVLSVSSQRQQPGAMLYLLQYTQFTVMTI